MTSPLVLLLVKVSLLLGAALAGAHLLRRAPAVSRHRLWSCVFAGILMLPLLTAMLPRVAVVVPAALTQPVDVPRAVPLSTPSDLSSAVSARTVGEDLTEPVTPAAEKVVATAGWSLRATLVAAWAVGATAAGGFLLLSLIRARRLARSAAPLEDADWNQTVRETAARLGMRRIPRVLISDAVATPMAGGALQPTVFVPIEARQWTAECRAVVLAHELAHLSRQDPLRQCIARLALAVYWFHPLAWLAARDAAAAREQACDEAVLGLGTRPSIYARVLLDFADNMPRRAPALAALPMIQRTLLEKRLMAILTNHTRPRARRLALVPVLAVAAFTLSVAAVDVQQAVAPTGGVGPGIAGGVPGGVMGAVPGGVPEGVPGGVSGGVSTGISGGVPAGDVGGIAGGTPSSGPDGHRIAMPTSQQPAPRDSACFFDGSGSFHGSISSSDRGGRTVIYEQVGQRGGDRIIQKRFGDLRVCAVAEGLDGDRAALPSQWPGTARRVMLETHDGREERRMELAGGSIVWTVNGRQQPHDARAEEWRNRLFDVLDTTWELSMLRGRESSLRGEISSIHGNRSSLEGQISSLRGQVSSMQGTISSLQGQESSLRGQISSIQGHLSSLQGAISSEQGAISSLQASRWDRTEAERRQIADRIAQHEKAISRIQEEIRAYDAPSKIREVERQIARQNVDARIAEVEENIRRFDVESKVAEVRKRIGELDVEDRVAAVERAIVALEVPRRSGELDNRLAEAIKRLEDALARLR